jgi:hypothetical protein
MKPQKSKVYRPSAGPEHAIAERNRPAGYHGDRRMKRKKTRSAQLRAAMEEW